MSKHLSSSSESQTAFNENFLRGLKYRLIGPFVGGRVSAVAGVPANPHLYYFGACAGGVWKTTDRGMTWFPIFDDQPIASIGAIAVSETGPDILYVGTGEANLRADGSHGNGVYKSDHSTLLGYLFLIAFPFCFPSENEPR